MKASELRQKTLNELIEQVKKLERDLSEYVLALLKGKEKNLKKPAYMKKDIARLRTVINEKKFIAGNK